MVQLIVNDGTVSSAPDTVTITASSGNSAPVADAGADTVLAVGGTVILNASGSSDADSDSLTYDWQPSSGPVAVSLDDATAEATAFRPWSAGAYVFSLVVNDGTVDSIADTVTVSVYALSSRGDHNLVVKPDNTLWASIHNRSGQLGLGDLVKRQTPTRVGNASDWAAVSTSGFTVGLRTDGTVWSWGNNYTEQLGDGTADPRSIPGRVCDVGTSAPTRPPDASRRRLSPAPVAVTPF